MVADSYGLKETSNLLSRYRNAAISNDFDSWKKLAKQLVKTKNTDDAIHVYNRILDSLKERNQTVQYIYILSSLASCYKTVGKIDESKKLYLTALALNTEKLDSKQIALDAFNLAEIYESERNMDLARSMLLKSKEYSEKSNDENNSKFTAKVSKHILKLGSSE